MSSPILSSPAFVAQPFSSTFLHPSALGAGQASRFISDTLPSVIPFRRCQIAAVAGKEAIGTENVTNEVSKSNIGSVTTMGRFWELADESKLNTQYLADNKIAFLKDASPEELRNICLQYRYFVERYPDNLSNLIRKMPNDQLKSELAMILSDELGSGKIEGSHIVWYDRFLRSIGVKEEHLENSLYGENSDLLCEIERRCNTQPYEHIIGLVGMSGECLCQIYLTIMHKYLVQNDYIRSLGNKVDWIFWAYHIGEDDIEHRMMVRKSINEIMTDGDGVQQLVEGYRFGKESWDLFWENNYKETRAAVRG